MAKLNDRCFCYFTAAMFLSLRGAQTWRHHTKFYKFEWNTFPNNARMGNRTDLKLGEVIYISIIFHISASRLNLLNGYDFYFWWRDTANQPETLKFEPFTLRSGRSEKIGRKRNLANRFHVAVRLFSNRSQMTSKCSKNKKVAHESIAECVTLQLQLVYIHMYRKN